MGSIQKYTFFRSRRRAQHHNCATHRHRPMTQSAANDEEYLNTYSLTKAKGVEEKNKKALS